MRLYLDPRLLIRRTLPLLAIALLLIAPALGKSLALASEPLGMKGIVDSRPSGTLLGDWSIDGQNFSVTQNTTFLGFGDFGPQVGSCVNVRYNQATAQTRIVVGMAAEQQCGASGEPDPTLWKGAISSRPEGGANGTWVIGGKSFSVTDATFFEGFNGARPVALTCVEVSYLVDGQVNVALTIRPGETCDGPGDLHSFRGPIDQRPDAKIGDWVIGGQVFTVTANTAFATVYQSGLPQVGDCVGLRYTEANGARTVVMLFPASCSDDPPGPEQFEAVGRVSAWPAGATFGAWTIGDAAYEARDGVAGPPPIPATIFDQSFGNLGIGVCALVNYRFDGATRVATRIATRPDFRCTSSAEVHQLYGLVKVLPDTEGNLGLWTVGDLQVLVNPNTRLSGAPFFVGQLVEVRFERAGDGTFVAITVEGKNRRGDEEHYRGRGKAFGLIGALPPDGLVGEWTIGHTPYAVSAETRLPEGYTPAVGDCVEVYFQIVDATHTAEKIRPAPGDCSDNAQEIGRAYGTVSAMPDGGYVGTWTVAGINYTATGDTTFDEEHGALAVGAFVELRYVTMPDGQVARSIRTLVPPGAGDDSRTGRLMIPDGLKDAATSATTVIWTVGGVSYEVNSDTLLEDGLGALQNGATVQVNAYSDPLSGALIATQVSATTSVFLPIIVR